MIELRRLCKRFESPDGETLRVLRDIDFTLHERGSSVAIEGPSGSGKSTLLGILAGLDRPSDGTVCIDGLMLGTLSEGALARFRAERLGFVFQSFQLLEQFSALQNVRIAAEIARLSDPARRAKEALEKVGLAARLGHLPSQLSGGECQRVAIARAIVTRPRLLLCDEPTGSLDPANAERVLDLLLALQQELSATLVLVTHDAAIAARLDLRLELERGQLRRVRRRDGSVVQEASGDSSEISEVLISSKSTELQAR